MARKIPRSRQLLALTALVAGVGIGSAGIASAATTSTAAPAASSSSSAPTAPPSGTAPDPATLSHGPGETLLTGSTLTSAEAAATAAEPGATIVRAETDAQGATYEVHMKKADGTYVTVKEDATFKVTSTESGFGAGPAGAPGGAPSSSGSSSGSSAAATN
jgi:hypothetical protein